MTPGCSRSGGGCVHRTSPDQDSDENGQVCAGDRLRVSRTLAGYATKMTESGPSIGVALADSASELDIIVAFVNLGYEKIEDGIGGDGVDASRLPGKGTPATLVPLAGGTDRVGGRERWHW